MYGATVSGSMFRLDPDTGEVRAFEESGVVVEQAADGTLHYTDGASMFTATIVDDDEPSEPAPTGYGASPVALVGRTANVWGTTDGEATGRTQVQLADGRWATSQIGLSDEDGWFVLPLTYGQHAGGSYTWRLVVEYEDGQSETTSAFTQRRLDVPSATSAGQAPAGRDANVWGSTDSAVGGAVWTEVQRPDGTWAVSQRGSVNAENGYVLPLTYGWNAEGTYRWRVGASYDGIGTVYSQEFSFIRS